jgi:hypothetical protein
VALLGGAPGGTTASLTTPLLGGGRIVLVAATRLELGARIALRANGASSRDARGAGAGGSVVLVAKSIVDSVPSSQRIVLFVCLFCYCFRHVIVAG